MQRLFVANAGEDSISVLCPVKMRETDRIPLGAGTGLGPRCIAVEAGRLIIANSFDSSIASLELASGALDFHPVGACPGSMCRIPEGWLVACTEANSIWKLNENLSPVAMASLGKFPFSVCCRGSFALATHLGSRDALLFDTHTLAPVTRIALEGNPFGALLLDDLLLVAQSLGSTGSISVYGYDGALRGHIALKNIPGRLVEVNGTVAAANYWGKGLFILDIDAMSITDEWKTSGMPDELAIDKSNGRLFVSCMLDNTVDVLEPSGKRLGSIRVGREPRGLAIADD